MNQKILQRRRRDLMDMLDGGVAIIATAHHQPRNGDVFFKFRPDSDFYYLTNFPEPEAVARYDALHERFRALYPAVRPHFPAE